MAKPLTPLEAGAEYRWARIWNVLAYILLAIALVVSWLDSQLVWLFRWLALGLVAVWGGWYWVFIVNHSRWKSRNLALGLSFIFAIELSTVLSFIHPAFLLLLFSFYGLSFSVMPVRWAVGLVAVLTVSLVVRFVAFSGGFTVSSIPLVISFIASAFFTVLLGLWIDSIIRQSRERQKMIVELETARSELAKAERQAGILEERQRLAGDIHDTLAQGFTSVVMHLEAADQALDNDPQAARSYILQAREAARQGLSEARSVLWALRPDVVEHEPLAQALRRVAGRWSDEAQVPAHLEVTGSARPLPAPFEATFLRAAQEALANVRKHARASQVNLTLSHMEDEVSLDIQDNGSGFDPAGLPQEAGLERGYGLIALQERVAQLGGRLVVESAPGEGTTVALSLPAGGDAHIG